MKEKFKVITEPITELTQDDKYVINLYYLTGKFKPSTLKKMWNVELTSILQILNIKSDIKYKQSVNERTKKEIILDEIRENLKKHLSYKEIADVLNEKGYRTVTGHQFQMSNVHYYIRHLIEAGERF